MKDIKYTFDHNRLVLPEDEIELLKDFDAVYAGISDTNNGFSSTHKWIIGSVGMFLLIAGSFYFSREMSTQNPANIVSYEVDSQFDIPRDQLLPIDIPKIEIIQEVHPNEPKESTTVSNIEQVNDKAADTLENPIQFQQTQFSPAIPEIGLDSFYTYLKANVRYPEEVTDSIEGRVNVKFTVNEDGSISDITIVQSLGEAFDQEAIRLVNEMPAWKPAYANSLPVSTKKQISIIFEKNQP